MEEEGKEFDDIIKGYPALSLEDKEKIKNTLFKNSKKTPTSRK